MRAGFAILGAGAMALAGCGDSNGAHADGDGEITAEEAAAEAAEGGAMNMRGGSWKQTISFSEISVPGAPDGMQDMLKGRMGEGVSTTQCLSDEEINDPDPEMFGGENQDNCEYEEFDRSGNSMTLRMTCAAGDGGTAVIAMDGEFSAERYEMQIDNTVSGTGMGDMTMKGTIVGERVGDC